MKREILCPACHSNRLARSGRDLSYESLLRAAVTPPEHIRYTRGFARITCNTILCDTCNVELEPGSSAVAVTTWTEDGSHKEPPAWERGYLDVA